MDLRADRSIGVRVDLYGWLSVLASSKYMNISLSCLMIEHSTHLLLCLKVLLPSLLHFYSHIIYSYMYTSQRALYSSYFHMVSGQEGNEIKTQYIHEK